MLHTRYHLEYSEYDVTLRGESVTILDATQSFVANVTETNPARAELLGQIALMKQSIADSQDCEITEQKHGYLRSLFLNLFDSGAVELICGDQIFTNAMVQKEQWSAGGVPGHSRGGYGGYQYQTPNGQIVFKQPTWIS